MINFRKVELEDQKAYKPYMAQQQCRSCECTFANLYLWSRFYAVTATVENGMLLTKSEEGDYLSYGFPMGKPKYLKEAVDALYEYSKEKKRKFQMHNVTPEQFALLEEIYPGRFQIEYRRDYADCFQIALKWRNKNGCGEDPEKNSEMCVTLNSLRLYKELDLRGGVLRAEGNVVAFSIGEPVSDDTFVVHIEKAFADVPGAYPMINQQFVEHEVQGFSYVNREEDMGETGLRSAKESYHPIFMVEKGIVTEKGE